MEALLYDKLSEKRVKCNVCNHYCLIPNHDRGKCGVRENKEGVLYSLNYGYTAAISIDPIEKKPLNNYMPHTMSYSFASVGCNITCPWCQNFTISQSPKPHYPIDGLIISPIEHIKRAQMNKCPSISYTYTEPTIFLEYALKVMKLAHQERLKNIWVSNGYMSKETIELILPYVDALNIDLKGNKLMYEEHNLGSYHKILENIKRFIDSGKHVEVTTLIIPGFGVDEFEEIASDLKKYTPLDTPWHISRFFPSYKMSNFKPTDKTLLYQLFGIAKDHGFTNVYLGNI